MYFLPFKGKGTLEAEQRARVGMGPATIIPHPHPNLPPEGEGVSGRRAVHFPTQYN
jgi:hypothetical protein